MNKLNNYEAQLYQFPSGRFLNLDETKRYKFIIKAESIDDAWDKVSELEQVDSEIPLKDRWSVNEIGLAS
jgi:hypothetical protein